MLSMMGDVIVKWSGYSSDIYWSKLAGRTAWVHPCTSCLPRPCSVVELCWRSDSLMVGNTGQFDGIKQTFDHQDSKNSR
jgi:hypothetical protein